MWIFPTKDRQWEVWRFLTAYDTGHFVGKFPTYAEAVRASATYATAHDIKTHGPAF